MHDAQHLVEVAQDDTTMGVDVEQDDTTMGVDVGQDETTMGVDIAEGASEVMYLTPSKVVHREPRRKILARKMISPFIVTTETREQLKNTLPGPNEFDPKRPIPDELTMKFFEYMQSEEDERMDYTVAHVDKTFFNVLITPKAWLEDSVN